MPDGVDEAVAALHELEEALEVSINQLVGARDRLQHLKTRRAGGSSWRDIVHTEDRPLVVETLTAVLDRLSAVGSRFRRAQAHALHAEGLSMERIASLFGVTRQRVSALLRERS